MKELMVGRSICNFLNKFQFVISNTTLQRIDCQVYNFLLISFYQKLGPEKNYLTFKPGLIEYCLNGVCRLPTRD
jgi:hypothetical protein